MDEEQGNVVHTHNGILVNLEKMEILPFVTTWMDLEDMLLSEIRQTEKDMHEEPKTGKLLAAENRRVAARGCGERESRGCFSGGIQFQLCKRSTF